MDSILLTTKLQVPPEPHHGILRPRLIETLERRLPHTRLTLVSAPAGYGKTTLLAQWARRSRFPVAWLSLSADDNDPDRFLRYLLAAWERVQPGVRETSIGRLLGSASPDRNTVLSAFINVAADRPDPLVLVLDDYHLIDDDTIHQALAFLVDHLPPTLRLVLAARTEPPLPLARYRARHDLVELRADDLTFLPDETSAFLRERMQLDLVAPEIEQLQAQIGGWVAGLQLAALTLQRRPSDSQGPVVSGRHRFIADYLRDDVLAPLSPDTQAFVLRTGILDRLTGSLCDAVVARTGSQALLEQLERANLFLEPLDDQRDWYRYHPLFADFLHAELRRRHPTEVPHLHARAAQWYAARDLPEPAFHHALAAESVALVTTLGKRYVVAKLMAGEVTLVRRWLDALPPAWHATQPEVGLLQAAFLLFTGQLDACAQRVDAVEQLVRTSGVDTRRHLAAVAAMRCFIACFQNDLPTAERLADEALPNLPADDDFGFRQGIYGALGDTYRRNGLWEQARACYLHVLDNVHPPTYRVAAVHRLGALADLELRRGRLRRAAVLWRRALADIEAPDNWGHYPLPVTGWVYIRLAEILYEWNDLDAAASHLAAGLERAELGGDVRALVAGYLITGRLRLAQGHTAAAAECLDRARPLLDGAEFPEWSARFDRLQLDLWLTQDEGAQVTAWINAQSADDPPAVQPERETALLALACARIARGGSAAIESALRDVRHVLAAANSDGRVALQIEALTLQALAAAHRDDPAAALVALERALRLAEPEGYTRLFTDLGLPMAHLLQLARARRVLPEYTDRLLAAFHGDVPLQSPSAALPEQLSTREQEVLAQLAAGLTNREIAAQLVISAETVKKHAANIYGKLGVTNRTQAVARARELDLLT